MHEVQRQTVDGRRELFELIEPPFLSAPVEPASPIGNELTQVADVGSVRPPVALQRLRDPPDSDEWSEWAVDRSASPGGEDGGADWIWREDRLRRLLTTADANALFVAGCKSNQGKFYPQFDHVVLLSAPTPVLLERLATRTTNPYGKRPDELARILRHIETVEPLLRRAATAEVDTSAPLEEVLETVLALVRA